MGIKTDVGIGVQEIFQEFADILTDITYRGIETETYIPGGAITKTYTEASLQCIITDFTMMEKQSNTVLNDDMKIIISGVDLSFVPDTKGIVIFADASEASIVSVRSDPTNSLYILQGRK